MIREMHASLAASALQILNNSGTCRMHVQTASMRTAMITSLQCLRTHYATCRFDYMYKSISEGDVKTGQVMASNIIRLFGAITMLASDSSQRGGTGVGGGVVDHNRGLPHGPGAFYTPNTCGVRLIDWRASNSTLCSREKPDL